MAPKIWGDRALDRVHECRIHNIAAELMTTTGGASKLVDRIEANGYCRRRPNPTDRRSSLVGLTVRGETVLAEARAAVDEELALRLGSVLAERTLRQFAGTSARLRAASSGSAREATA